MYNSIQQFNKFGFKKIEKTIETFLTEKKDISMTGHVVVESDKGDRITTDHLNYVDAEKKIHTDAPVTMANQRIEVKGVGLTFLLDERHLTLSHQVQATIRSTR